MGPIVPGQLSAWFDEGLFRCPRFIAQRRFGPVRRACTAGPLAATPRANEAIRPAPIKQELGASHFVRESLLKFENPVGIGHRADYGRSPELDPAEPGTTE
jgi:hypothetical protein